MMNNKNNIHTDFLNYYEIYSVYKKTSIFFIFFKIYFVQAVKRINVFLKQGNIFVLKL